MKLLVLVSNYPHSGYLFSGIFNERSILALNELCEKVEVLAPRPYAPSFVVSLVPRWQAYARILRHEVRNGIPVHRPAYLQIPRGGAFWTDPGIFLWCRCLAKQMHARVRFDAILSFDLVEAGGTAWRLGRELGIPAGGWATGSDMRTSATSPHRKILIQALKHLDIVFYQNHEFLEKAVDLLGISQDEIRQDKYLVLPRGIEAPPLLLRTEIRSRIRKEWGITADQVIVLFLGRITRKKGLFELLEAVSLATTQDPRVICILIGSNPAFDETNVVQKKLSELSELKQRVKLVPACSPDKVWQYLCAADIFAFPSHEEGMPNSLLEALAMGVPAIAFAIPPVQEIEAGTGGLILIPPFDSVLFAKAILHLATSPTDRIRIGQAGRTRVMDNFMVRKNMAEALSHLSRITAVR